MDRIGVTYHPKSEAARRCAEDISARLRPLFLGALILAAGAGAGALVRPSDFREGPLTVGLQPNIPQIQRERRRTAENLRIHGELLDDFRRRNPGLRPDLLVYSETSFPSTREPEYTLPGFLEAVVPAPGTNQ